jgi:YbgC/YbaW family acyl-CoA thioester hydrolase
MIETPSPADFTHRSRDKLRYADTDKLGHVNNAAFSTFFETGRVELLHDPRAPLNAAGCGFVIARVAIDFAAEILWPGEVEIGTRVAAIGRSSIRRCSRTGAMSPRRRASSSISTSAIANPVPCRPRRSPRWTPIAAERLAIAYRASAWNLSQLRR